MKELKDMTTDDILIFCAELRGVAGIENRTIHEFAWFIDEVLFGEFKERKDYSPIGKEPIRCWALPFMKYCIEEYGESYLKEKEEFDRFLEEITREAKK